MSADRTPVFGRYPILRMVYLRILLQSFVGSVMPLWHVGETRGGGKSAQAGLQQGEVGRQRRFRPRPGERSAAGILVESEPGEWETAVTLDPEIVTIPARGVTALVSCVKRLRSRRRVSEVERTRAAGRTSSALRAALLAPDV